MTSLAAVLGVGGVRSIQTGYINSTRDGGSSGEVTSYKDVTITAVTDTDKCIALFDGAFYESNIGFFGSSSTSVDTMALATAQLTSTTNLRIGSAFSSAAYNFVGRWYVIEYY